MRILVIEDDAEVLGMICKMLSDEDYDVVAAVNGKEGIELLRKESNVVLVITDLIMPKKEGIKVIRELKQDFPPIKILAISGRGCGSLQNYLILSKAMGADLTLSKPFVKKELLKVVRELLEHK